MRLTPKDDAVEPRWDDAAFADKGAAVEPRSYEVGTGESAEQIEKLIRDRLEQKMRKLSNFRYQHAYAVFQDAPEASPSQRSGRRFVTKEALGDRLARKLDVNLSADQLDAVFKRYDVEGRGALDLRDLVKRLVPCDFPGSARPASRGGAAGGGGGGDDAPGKRRARVSHYHVPKHVKPHTIANPDWAVDDIEALLREKIGGSRRPLAHYEYQNIFRLFSRAPLATEGGPDAQGDAAAPAETGRHAKALTPRRFGQVLKQYFGLVLTAQQTADLFLRYDPSGLGRLSVIIRNMLPKDWTPSCGVLPKAPKKAKAAPGAPQGGLGGAHSPLREPLHLVEFPVGPLQPEPKTKAAKKPNPAPFAAAGAPTKGAAAEPGPSPSPDPSPSPSPSPSPPEDPPRVVYRSEDFAAVPEAEKPARPVRPSSAPATRRRPSPRGAAPPPRTVLVRPKSASRPKSAGGRRNVSAVRYRAHQCNDKVRDILKVRGLYKPLAPHHGSFGGPPWVDASPRMAPVY